jgi:hypothetical protein
VYCTDPKCRRGRAAIGGTPTPNSIQRTAFFVGRHCDDGHAGRHPGYNLSEQVVVHEKHRGTAVLEHVGRLGWLAVPVERDEIDACAAARQDQRRVGRAVAHHHGHGLAVRHAGRLQAGAQAFDLGLHPFGGEGAS